MSDSLSPGTVGMGNVEDESVKNTDGGETDVDVAATNDEQETQRTPDWAFGTIRIVRVLVGVLVLFVLLLDFEGTFQRAVEDPVLLAIAVAAIAQFIQIEDIDKFRELIGR